jgi:multidrug efflux pump subunit AcrB
MQPGANVDVAVAQVTAVSQTLLRGLPPGIFPPLVVVSDASSVPIIQLGLSSNTLTEQQLYDYGQNFIRTRLATVPGISVPLPYGGKVREVMIDLDHDALYGKGLSATDISNALNLQNLILPTGTVKVGTREYQRRNQQRRQRHDPSTCGRAGAQPNSARKTSAPRDQVPMRITL